MTTDVMKIFIDFFEMILQRANITRLIDDLSALIDTAITFLPRLGLVLGYISYFVDWPLILPLILIVFVAFVVRTCLALYNAVAQVIP